MKIFTNIALSCALATVLVGCAAPHLGVYTLNLNNVECIAADANRSFTPNNQQLSKVNKSDGTTDYVFEDTNLHIVWSITNIAFCFTLENRSAASFRIPWDEAAYVDQKGLSRKVIHKDIKYEHKDNPQAPTVVARNSRIEDHLIPTENIVPENKNFATWKTYHLFYDRSKNIGQEVTVVLPIVIGEEKTEYSFHFKVTDWYDNTPEKKGFFHKIFRKK